MITLFYQTEIGIPNSIPPHLRSVETTEYKSVKPTFIAEICNYLKIPFRQVDKKTWNGESAYYHVEIEWIDQAMIYRNIFEWIDDDILKIIKDRHSQLKLLLWFPNEGFSLSMPRFIEVIDFCLKDLDIPPSKVYFVFGDVNIEQNYKKWQNKMTLLPINVYGFDSFETTYHNECRILEKLGFADTFLREKQRVQNLNRIRNQKFIFRNANPREHRLYFASELKNKNLLEKSYFSWLNRYYTPDTSMNRWIIERYCEDSSRYQTIDRSMKDFLAGSPYVVDYNANDIGNELNQRVLIPDHFLDSYFTFVTETTFANDHDENVLFLTEKIYQPILQYHPFIVAACPGMLEYMRKYGYQTFPELFDESYDQEQDLKRRTKMILDNIEHVCNMSIDDLHQIYYSDHFQQKLVHNKKLFVEGKGKIKWEEAIKWLDH
jgi:hypothetical protein